MKITVQRISKRTALFTASAVLAVNSLFVVVPHLTTRQVEAVGGSDKAVVTTASELEAAAADTNIRVISLKANVTVPNRLVFSGRTVFIDGNNNTVSYNGVNGWAREYVMQAYRANLGLKNIKITGGDAAILANGGTVTTEGTVDVSGNEFGGIEVTSGSGVAQASALNVKGAIVNNTEATGKPTVWIDGLNKNSVVTGPFTEATHIKSQKQYYINNVFADIVATNTTQARTYNDINVAIEAANTSDVIVLAKDVTLNEMVKLNKGVTLDGNGKTLTATYSYTANGVDNAVILVEANGAAVKNLTTSATSTGQKPHGIVAQNVTGLSLTDVTLKNNRAGLIVNGSSVSAQNIHTSGSSWYGINVDRAGAHLTISGANSHDSNTYAIYSENGSIATVTADSQYARINNPADTATPALTTDVAYVLKSAVPTAAIKVNGKSSTANVSDKVITVEGIAGGVNAAMRHWFEVKAPNGQHYYKYFTTTSFDLASLKTNGTTGTSLPVDAIGRPLAGTYQIRYVVTDTNNVKNDIVAPALFTLIVEEELVEEVTPDPDPVTPTTRPTTPESNTQAQNQNQNQTPAAASVTFPLAINPGAADVLGDSDTTQPEARDVRSSSDGDVQGATTFAQAETDVTSDANTGKFMGIAWYWWLLIVASVLGLIWGIVAAARNRRDDE